MPMKIVNAGSCGSLKISCLPVTRIDRFNKRPNCSPAHQLGAMFSWVSGCLNTMKPCIIRRAGKTGSRRVATRGGKSGLHRAQCQLTAGRGNTTESGAESKTADGATRTGKGEKVR